MSTRAKRAAARNRWPSGKSSLAAMSEPRAELTGQQAWDAVMELTLEAYSLAGGIAPSRPRSQWPSRLYRPGEKRPDSHGL